MPPLSEFDKNWCTKLLTDLSKWPITSPFRVPVDPERDGAPTYRTIVTHPMDFQTMRKKLASSEYRNVQEFIDDIQLICDNAKLFNGASSMYGLICDDVMAEVQKQYSEKPTSADDDWYKSLMKSVQLLDEHMRCAPPDVSLTSVYLDPPAVDVEELPEAKRAKIQKEIGSEKLSNLRKKWLLLSEPIRSNIIAVIGED
jgi:hypothetical protein